MAAVAAERRIARGHSQVNEAEKVLRSTDEQATRRRVSRERAAQVLGLASRANATTIVNSARAATQTQGLEGTTALLKGLTAVAAGTVASTGGGQGGPMRRTLAGARNPRDLLERVESLGIRVGENRLFDPVDPVHTSGSYHYRNKRGVVRGDRQGVMGADLTGPKLAKVMRIITQLYGGEGGPLAEGFYRNIHYGASAPVAGHSRHGHLGFDRWRF